MSKLLTKIKASVYLIPEGSHVVILALVALLGLSLICTFIFIFYNVSYWLPISVSAVLLGTIIFFWCGSHRDVDNKKLSPIKFSHSVGNSSTNITIPPGGLSSSEKLKFVEHVVSLLRYQKPLPASDGVVDDDGNPIPQSQEEARERVETINSEVRKSHETFGVMDSQSNSPDHHQFISQPNFKVIPEVEKTNEFNKSDDYR